MKQTQTPSVTIVGAGLASSLLSILLARRGFQVAVYEKRPDPRHKDTPGEHRSINLGLSHRGLTALNQVGLATKILSQTVPMRGRLIHNSSGEKIFQPYGKNDREILHSIRRDYLLTTLIEEATNNSNVQFYFNWKCTELDKDSATITVKNTQTDEEKQVTADFVVGADGAFSWVQRTLRTAAGFTYAQENLEWGYKELTIPLTPDGKPRLDNIEALHLWPRDNSLVVGHPNEDGSVTATLFLAWEGQKSFSRLKSAADVQAFFEQDYPELLELIPDLNSEFANNPVGMLLTSSITPWYYQDKVVLVGDACHAVYPFYGQGMNSAFEDCLVLDECLGRHLGDWQAAFSEFQTIRKVNTDTLAQLSRQNFIELRDKVRSPLFLLRRRLDILLNRLLPEAWLPLPTMVVHTSIPYAKAVKRAKQQDYILYTFSIGSSLALVGSFLKLALNRKK